MIKPKAGFAVFTCILFTCIPAQAQIVSQNVGTGQQRWRWRQRDH